MLLGRAITQQASAPTRSRQTAQLATTATFAISMRAARPVCVLEHRCLAPRATNVTSRELAILQLASAPIRRLPMERRATTVICVVLMRAARPVCVRERRCLAPRVTNVTLPDRATLRRENAPIRRLPMGRRATTGTSVRLAKRVRPVRAREPRSFAAPVISVTSQASAARRQASARTRLSRMGRFAMTATHAI